MCRRRRITRSGRTARPRSRPTRRSRRTSGRSSPRSSRSGRLAAVGNESGSLPIYSQAQLIIDTGQFIAGESATALARRPATAVGSRASSRSSSVARQRPVSSIPIAPRATPAASATPRPKLPAKRRSIPVQRLSRGRRAPIPPVVPCCDQDRPRVRPRRSRDPAQPKPRATQTGAVRGLARSERQGRAGRTGWFHRWRDAAQLHGHLREHRDRDGRRVRGDGHRPAGCGEVRPRHVQPRADLVRRQIRAGAAGSARASRPRSTCAPA